MKLCSSCRNGLLGSPSDCPVCAENLRAAGDINGDALAGMRVGDRYELVELLGEGAMGWVYRAVHVALGRSVAIKLLKTAEAPEAEQIARFEQEARTVSRLNHPHIVSIIDFGRTPGGLFYLVTEFVVGTSLAELMAAEGPLPLARVLGLFHQILAAVEEAHGTRVVHRDLKPENIVVTPLRGGEDFAKVLDFGIALLVDDPTAGRPGDSGFAGTPGFMAPETIREGVATTRSDVYALGAILYEMLAGRAPFEHEQSTALLLMHVEDEPEPLRQAAPGRGLSAELERVVARALAKNPRDRFASVAELRTELFEAANALGRVELACDRCTRPMDPETGLCGLHGPCTRAPRSAGAPSSRSRRSQPDSSSRTMIHPATVTRESLIERTLAVDLSERRADVEALVDFLLGERQLLEIAGDPGMGRDRLLAGLAATGERLGMRVLRIRPDPRQAFRPWYPLRQLVGEIIGCGAEPASARTMLHHAEAAVSDATLARELGLLFGFSHPGAPEPGPDRAQAIGAAVCGLITATERDTLGTCVLAARPLQYDRATLGWIRALPRLFSKRLVKIAASTDGALWEPAKYRTVLHTQGLDAEGVASLIDRVGTRGDVDKVALGLLSRRAAGNAFHAEQAVHAHSEGGNVDWPLDQLLMANRQASERSRRLLRVVCALGEDVPVGSLTEPWAKR